MNIQLNFLSNIPKTNISNLVFILDSNKRIKFDKNIFKDELANFDSIGSVVISFVMDVIRKQTYAIKHSHMSIHLKVCIFDLLK